MLKHADNVKVCHSGIFRMILTLPTVVSHVAFLTLAVVLRTCSPVHTPNIAVLDCGHNNTSTHTHTQTYTKSHVGS